jgi:taurine dioxygenase
MRVTKLSDAGGVSVEGVDFTRPVPADIAAELMRLYDEEGLLVIRDQQLTEEQLLAATEPFGGSEVHVAVGDKNDALPGVTVISTRGNKGHVTPEEQDAIVGDIDFHTDQAYVVAPNRGKLLYAVAVPEEGGKTGFIDGARTYDALPAATKAKIDKLHVIQSWKHAQATIHRNRGFYEKGATQLADDRFSDVAYPLVIRHPRTGRKSLNVPPLWSAGIVELPGAEGEALVAELIAHIRKPEFAYWHGYRLGDVVAWDNWRYVHAAGGTPGRYVRTLWSTVIKGGPVIGEEIAPRVAA